MKIMIIVRGKTLIGKFWTRVSIVVSDSGYIVGIFKSPKINRYYLSKVDAIYNAKDELILPGLIDCHVHFRDPGLTHKEDFESGSKCAIASGVTIVGDMPNNNPRVRDTESYLYKIKNIEGKSYCDYFLYTELNISSEIEKLLHLSKPPRAVKIYLYRREHYDLILGNSFPKNTIYVFHAEHPDYLKKSNDGCVEKSFRPPRAEHEGIKLAIQFARQGYRVHITHLSTRQGLMQIINAKNSGMDITCDVTPHHLVFYQEEIDTMSPLFLVLPPIRRKIDRDYLISALRNGYVDAICSDHAPHLKIEKEKNRCETFGIQSLQYLLPIMFSLCKKFGIDFRKVLPLMSRNPAEIFNIVKRGWIKRGNYADLVIFDPRKKWVVDPEACYSKAKFSPYDSMLLQGHVEATFLRGRLVYENGVFIKRIGQHI